MNHEYLLSILEDIRDIDRKNLFLEYIVDRVQSDDYRGWHVSQHNRKGTTKEEAESILKAIHRIAGEGEFDIPPGDSGDEWSDGEYCEYRRIVCEIKENIGKGTLNSVKKNHFPDLERMGFMERGRLGNTIINGRLSSRAMEFVRADSEERKSRMFTDGIKRLFGERLTELINIMRCGSCAGEEISTCELMLIVSDERIGVERKMEMLNSFRDLEEGQQKNAERLIEKYADPANFPCGNKTDKRDFGNWENQTKQMIGLLQQTPYFSWPERGEGLRLIRGMESDALLAPS